MKRAVLSTVIGFVALATLLAGGAGSPEALEADYDFYYLRASSQVLKFAEDAWPRETEESREAIRRLNWNRRRTLSQAAWPFAALDGEGEVYVWSPTQAQRTSAIDRADTFLAVRVPKGKPVAGRLYLPKHDLSGMTSLHFALVDRPTSPTDAQGMFYQTKQRHYSRLQQRNIPGAAWFRHQAAEAKAALSQEEPATTAPARPPRRTPARETELARTYNLFSGGRAVSENLQLDRVVNVTNPSTLTVAVESIPGITVQEMDWKPLVEGLKPDTDPLAALIPADQHALFFPSFEAMATMVDEAKDNGTPVLRLLEPRSEDARTHERYERQLCIPLDAVARVLGPKLVSSVAATGSDPYLRTGSDFTVLFEAPDVNALKLMIAGRQAAATQTEAGAKAKNGKIEDVPYAGVVSPGRAICSYMASISNVVVVTNSLRQLRRIVQTHNGKTPSMGSLDEYTFFRDRYKRGDKDETALLILTDAAIRRWCGPRWRIAASRRTRVAAAMSELQAEHLETLRKGGVRPKVLDANLAVADAGKIRLTGRGIESSVYGTLDFLTPISEIPLEKVTSTESRAYETFRRNYQRNWRQFFDPIAIRFSVASERIAADISVMPLIAGSDYRQFIQVTGSGNVAGASGDPHPETLLHFVMSIDVNSEPVKEVTNLAVNMAPGLGPNAAGWLGGSIALYADVDPFWQDLLKAYEEDKNKIDEFFESEYYRLPVALHCEVSSVMKLTAFLTALRAFIEQSSPGNTSWQTLQHNDMPYVRITPSETAKADEENIEKLAVYYAANARGLIITLNENLLKRALDRQAVRRKAKVEGKEAPPGGPPWVGKSFAVQAQKSCLSMIEVLTREPYRDAMQARSWGAIPILNEWRRHFGIQSPVEFHQRFWQTKLVCPGGGEYVWNEKWQTMESTVFGHPGEPKPGPATPAPLARALSGNLGVTFEHGGLRARGEIERKARQP